MKVFLGFGKISIDGLLCDFAKQKKTCKAFGSYKWKSEVLYFEMDKKEIDDKK